MRVAAFLRDVARPIGALLMTAELLDAVAARGHEVDVFVDATPRADRLGRLNVRHRSQAGALRPDVVVAHPDQGATAPLFAARHRAPYVGIVHNVAERTGFLLARYRPALTVWNAHATREAHGGRGGIVVRSPLRVAEHRAEHRGQAVTLVNVQPDKGSDVFLALADRLAHLAPFLGVRGGWGEQTDGVGHPVEIVDPVPPPAMRSEVWPRTRVLLAPSLSESWGRVPAEALCSGVPVVAHPTPGLVECLGDAATFVDRDDLDGWERAVRRLLTDDEHYAERSKAAQARALDLEEATAHDLDAFADALERVARR